VIVPARNAEATLPRTLEALARQDFDAPFEVIVVDNGSTDRTVELARAVEGPIRVLEQSNLGAAAGRNRGVAESSGPLLAFCDSDCFPTPGWLRAGVGALESTDLVQGHVLPDPTAELGPFDRSLWVTFEVGLYETASLFVTRRTFEQTGGFEEWISDHGRPIGEDLWFGWSARRLGARSSFCAEALAHHAVFPRGWREYAGERRRLRSFPAIAAKVPELRLCFFYRRLFLNRRSAALDTALAGAVAALVARSPFPLLLGLPYARMVVKRSRGWPGQQPRVAAGEVISDLVGLASLAQGTLRYRSLLL